MIRVIMRWIALSEDERVKIPWHPFWMACDTSPPPRAAVQMFNRVRHDLALPDGLLAWLGGAG